MTGREIFLKTLNFEKPDGRLPMVEWAPWWDKTIERWRAEGLDSKLDWAGIGRHFGLDVMHLIYGVPSRTGLPKPAYHGAPVIENEADYEKYHKLLYTDEAIENAVKAAHLFKPLQEQGEIIRVWLDGYFWFPRTLFGIEGHLFAFYDYPELMHRMNSDLTDFNIKVIDAILPILKPDVVGFGEDLSYNHGPMLSYEQFKEFITPYYQRVIPEIKKHGIKVLMDSDGDITEIIPWLYEAGVEGIYPLERQAGVDLNKIRQNYPDFIMMGGYDKMVMPKGEAAMRAEFERLLPVMASGGYIASIDHQTPPGVSMENYEIYLRLFKEYSEKAINM